MKLQTNFFKARGELSVCDDLLLYKERIVVPESMKVEMMEKIHGVAHLRLTKCRERMQTSVWWPGISTDMNDFIERCDFCQVNRRRQKAEPLKPCPLPDRPWQNIAADLCEYNNKSYLVTVDAFSRWIEIDSLETTSSKAFLKKFEVHFSRFGYPEHIRSDGGPQFSSHEFEIFCKTNGIEHSVSAPHFPQGNGSAERAVQTAERLLKTENPVKALLDYRSTPLQVTGYAPSQLLMGRMLRTTLPVKNETLSPCWPNMQEVKKTRRSSKEEKC